MLTDILYPIFEKESNIFQQLLLNPYLLIFWSKLKGVSLGIFAKIIKLFVKYSNTNYIIIHQATKYPNIERKSHSRLRMEKRWNFWQILLCCLKKSWRVPPSTPFKKKTSAKCARVNWNFSQFVENLNVLR